MNKKAVSEIVSYTIIIVIAVGISALVYTSLKLYLPSEKQTCPEKISIIIQSAVCNNSYLELDLKNQGLFSISALYIRMANVSRTTRTQINQDEEILVSPIAPGGIENWNSNVTSVVKTDGTYTIEVQPAIVSKQRVIMCERAVITENVECKAGGGAP